MAFSNAVSFQLGISSYSYPWAIGLEGMSMRAAMDGHGLVEQAAGLKVDRLQLADNLPVDQLPADNWAALIRRADEYGIGLELGMRGLIEDDLLRYLGLALQCRSSFLRVVIDKGTYVPSYDQIVDVLRKVLPDFRRAGIVLAIENHDRFRAETLIRIIKETDPDWIGICLDTANSLGADEGLRQVAVLLAPYTVNLHFKDYRIERFAHQMGFQVSGVPAGTGQIPAIWLLDLLRQAGRCRSVILEVWSSPLENITETIEREARWVEAGVRFLRSII